MACITSSSQKDKYETVELMLRWPNAVPIEVFGHVVYSWVCKHPYVYARLRRTSGSN
jgi:hypothetical protein